MLPDLVYARVLMIDTGKSSRAGSVILWFDFYGFPNLLCQNSSIPNGEENLRYSDVRRNRSRLAAFNRRDSQGPLGISTI